jgi:hypothetical protein
MLCKYLIENLLLNLKPDKRDIPVDISFTEKC